MYALRLFLGISAVAALVCMPGLSQQSPAPAPARPGAVPPQEPTIRFGTSVNGIT